MPPPTRFCVDCEEADMRVGDTVVRPDISGEVRDVDSLGDIVGETDKIWFIEWRSSGELSAVRKNWKFIRLASASDIERHSTLCWNARYRDLIKGVLDRFWKDIPTEDLAEFWDIFSMVEGDMLAEREGRRYWQRRGDGD